MKRLVALPFRAVCDIVEANGFQFQRNTKHNALYVHPDHRNRLASIPRHDRIAIGTLRSITRDSRKPREHFER